MKIFLILILIFTGCAPKGIYNNINTYSNKSEIKSYKLRKFKSNKFLILGSTSNETMINGRTYKHFFFNTVSKKFMKSGRSVYVGYIRCNEDTVFFNTGLLCDKENKLPNEIYHCTDQVFMILNPNALKKPIYFQSLAIEGVKSATKLYLDKVEYNKKLGAIYYFKLLPTYVGSSDFVEITEFGYSREHGIIFAEILNPNGRYDYSFIKNRLF